MAKEWEYLWTKIWHIAGREKQLEQPGDYIVHNFMRESVVIVKQRDGSLKGFYNACGHRAQRLVWQDGSQDCLTCPYHGWQWGLDGVLQDCPDRDDFLQGDPVGKLKLRAIRVGTWAGLVWYTMDEEAPDLMAYLEPTPELYKNHQFEKTIRVNQFRVALDTNWKFWSDNFNESYHTRTVHPQVPPIIDQDHFTSRYEMFPMGHNRIVQMGRPSLRDRLPDDVPHPFDDMLRAWDIDPDQYPDYETKALQGWHDLKAEKRKRWKEKGYLHYETLDDEDLTESPFQVLFPNVAIAPSADSFLVWRWEPHPTDPEKCYFEQWTMAYPIAGVEGVRQPHGCEPDSAHRSGIGCPGVRQRRRGARLFRPGGVSRLAVDRRPNQRLALQGLSRTLPCRTGNPGAALPRSAERLLGRQSSRPLTLSKQTAGFTARPLPR